MQAIGRGSAVGWVLPQEGSFAQGSALSGYVFVGA